MTHWFRTEELPEIPRGQGGVERTIAVLIIVIGLLGSLAGFLEIQAVSREATDDRQAKLRLVEEAASAVDRSRRKTAAATAAAARADAAVAQRSLATSPTGYARLHSAALRRAVGVVSGDPVLRAEGSTTSVDERYYKAVQLAKAYERRRDARTFQVRRFVSVITDFAVALLLLGVVVTIPARGQRWFIGFSCVIAVATLVWGVHVWRSGGKPINVAAIQQYVRAQTLLDHATTMSEAARARAGFDAALRLDRSYHDAYVGRGFVNYSTGSYSAAASDFGEATRLDSGDFLAWNALAASRWWEGDYGGAFAANEQAARLNTSDPWVSYNRLEGLAVSAPSQREAYRRQLGVFRDVLLSLRQDAVAMTRLAFADLRQSSSGDASIRPVLSRVCRDVRTVARSAGVASRYDCRRLPKVTLSTTAWVGVP